MTEILSKEYWENRYKNGDIGWDMGEVSPPLKTYFDQIENKDLKILIPGCGNSYEAEYLAKKGFTDITVIDIAMEPVARLQNILKEHSSCKIIQQDYFEHDRKYDLIIEQTFFCALDRSLRSKYVRKMSQLLNDNGKLTGVLFKTEFPNPGPPFGGTADEYRELFQKQFDVRTMSDCYNSHEKRAGNELFIQFVKR